MSLALEPDVSSLQNCRSRGRQAAGRSADTTDIALVPDALWREAERRAAVIRPLAALPVCPHAQASAAAKELGVSERQVYRLLRRCREGGGELTARHCQGKRFYYVLLEPPAGADADFATFFSCGRRRIRRARGLYSVALTVPYGALDAKHPNA